MHSFARGYSTTAGLKADKANDEKLAKIPDKLGANYPIRKGRDGRNRASSPDDAARKPAWPGRKPGGGIEP